MTNIGLDGLIGALTTDMTPEEAMLAGFQGIIAAQISMKRQDMGMKQKEFAEYMGVTQGMVSRWEKGDCNFTLSTLIHIASKLDIGLQCPFVTEAPPIYRDGTQRLLAFPGYYGGASPNQIWSQETSRDDELKEM